MTVLVTGALGSIGTALAPRLEDAVLTDIAELDVTDEEETFRRLREFRPSLVYHLAGAKHAPEGEADPLGVVRVNTLGTDTILRAAAEVGAKVVAASTCKACDPETAYGASKLVAERMVLNAGGVVVRYFNVPETSGNVFRLWEQIPEPEPIPWTDCWRYFIPLRAAVELTLTAAHFPSGRYITHPGPPRHMREVAKATYPGRKLVEIDRRRGDRRREPLHAQGEWREHVAGLIYRVRSSHDWADAARKKTRPKGSPLGGGPLSVARRRLQEPADERSRS